MAKSILDIVIKVTKEGGGDKETVNSLVNLKKGYGEVMAAMGAAAGVAVTLNQVYQNTVKVFMDYASQVRETSRLTGMSAEETSKLIQAADDLTVSYESLNKALWAASKQGIDVSIESLADLADQYVAIQDPAQRAEFLAKKFGKSGFEMGKLLQEGGRGVKEMTDAISGGLVLTDEAVRSAREYEIALDNMGDAVEGVKVSVGQDLVAAFAEVFFAIGNAEEITAEYNRLIETGLGPLEAQAKAIENVTRAQNTNNGEIDSATMSYMAWAEAMGLVVPVLEEVVSQTDAISTANLGMIGLIGQLQSQTDSYNEKNQDLKQTYDELVEKQSKYWEGGSHWREMQVKIDETGKAISDLAAEHEDAGRRIAFSLLQQKLAVDGMTDAEFNALLTMGKSWGILDADVVAAAESMNQQMGFIADSVKDPIKQVSSLNQQTQTLMNRAGSEWNFYVNIHTRGAFPSLPSKRGTNSGPGSGYLNNVGMDAEFGSGGGQLNGSWTLVGDPGPYAELISPSGYVHDAETTKQLLDSGMFDNIRALRIGGDLAGTGVFEGGGSGTPSPRPRRKNSGGSSSITPSVVNHEVNQASQAVSIMADITAAAVQGSASVQQATAMQTQQLVSSIQISNETMSTEQRETNRLLREQAKNLPRELVAAMIQANP